MSVLRLLCIHRTRSCAPKKVSVSECNLWCNHLIENPLSVMQGNVLKHLRKSHQFPKLNDCEFQILDCV